MAELWLSVAAVYRWLASFIHHAAWFCVAELGCCLEDEHRVAYSLATGCGRVIHEAGRYVLAEATHDMYTPADTTTGHVMATPADTASARIHSYVLGTCDEFALIRLADCLPIDSYKQVQGQLFT